MIVEGLYLHLDEPIWRSIHKLFDLNVWIELELDESADRLVKRHVKSGVSDTEEKALERVKGNDLVNARHILDHRLPADVEIYL